MLAPIESTALLLSKKLAIYMKILPMKITAVVSEVYFDSLSWKSGTEIGLHPSGRLCKSPSIVKNLILPKERSGLCHWSLGRSFLSPWNVLPDKSVLAYLGALDHTRMSTNVIYGGSLSHMISVQLLKELDPESATWALNRGTPIKTLDTEAQMSFPG